MIAFSLRYAAQELRRRRTRVLLTALGLASGVSLVVAVSSVSEGFNHAESQILAPLHSLGTDILVTRTANTSAVTGPSSGASASSDADTRALIDANRSLVTDLAKMGKPGQHFTRDFFLLSTMLPLQAGATHELASLPHVLSATGALTLLATHQTGTVPAIVAQLTTGGQTITQLHQPAPLTATEATQVRSCILSDGGLNDLTKIATNVGSAAPTTALPQQIESCLPSRFREYVASITVPMQTVRQVLNPPQTDITSTNYTVAGLDASASAAGLVTANQVVAGRYLAPGAPDEAMADVGYAATARLHVGSTVPINGSVVRVVGLVSASLGGQSANLYLPLPTLQRLASHSAQVNLVLVRAATAADVSTVVAEIHRVLPDAQLTTAAAVADQVKGSLATAKHLTRRFGGALAAIVLVAAFLIAILLTLGTVAKRVREIGTLRAVGWSRRRVVGQLVVETLGIGVIGAVAGVVLGVLVAAGISHLAPPLVAHAPSFGPAGTSIAKIAGAAVQSTADTSVHMHIVAKVAPITLLWGAALALLGGLLAGGIGGWRASRLMPVVALRDIG